MRLTVEVQGQVFISDGEWRGHHTTLRRYRNLTINTDAMKHMTEDNIRQAAEYLGAQLAQAILRDIKQAAAAGRLDVSWFKAEGR